MNSEDPLKEFKALIEEYTEGYEDYVKAYNNSITYEFSTSKDSLADKLMYLMSKQVYKGHWRAYECSTCRQDNPETPIHVEIESSFTFEEYAETINKLTVDNMNAKHNVKEVLDELQGKEYYPKGTLSETLDLIDALVDKPEQYPEYLNATFISDHNKKGGSIRKPRSHEQHIDPLKKYNKSVQILESLLVIPEKEVLHSQSRNTRLKGGSSGYLEFSEINGGCCASVHLNNFYFIEGRQVKVTVSLLNTTK